MRGRVKRRGRLRYERLVDGEWLTPRMKGFKEQCCDCALVHRVDFRIRDGQLEFRATQDRRATAAARKMFGFGTDE